ncbi:MAG: spore coat U domain-containing protein [Terracidiphilus sp.]|jgi:spore coat protein U-like protein
MKLSSLVKSVMPAAVVSILALGLAPMSAFAGTATANMAVSVTVNSNCTISANALGFGTYTGAVNQATTTLSVQCTNTTPYNVGLSAGATTNATVTTRQMLNGTAALNYTLTTSSYTGTNWGNTSGSWVGGTGNGNAQTLTVYGQIPAGQFVTPGSYADTVVATVNY